MGNCLSSVGHLAVRDVLPHPSHETIAVVDDARLDANQLTQRRRMRKYRQPVRSRRKSRPFTFDVNAIEASSATPQIEAKGNRPIWKPPAVRPPPPTLCRRFSLSHVMP